MAHRLFGNATSQWVPSGVMAAAGQPARAAHAPKRRPKVLASVSASRRRQIHETLEKKTDSVQATGFESEDTSASNVVDRRVRDADQPTQDDAKRRDDSALSASCDRVEFALAQAVHRAAEAGRFDILTLLAGELQAHRLARDGVFTRDAKRRRRGA
jgi:hypothetical protein